MCVCVCVYVYMDTGVDCMYIHIYHLHMNGGVAEVAAAMFILGGSLSDAVTVCVRQLKDYQLALVICRLVEGE